MITPRAKDAFDRLLKQSIGAGLQTGADDRCSVEAVGELQGMKADKAVILTVSSYLFRLITIVYFTLDEPTRRHFARVKSADAQDMSDDDFHDVIAEHGNIICGSLNRDIGRHFPHVGMSTPNIIDRHCADYLHELGSGLIQHYKATINDEVSLHATFCACDYADLDFELPRETQAESSTGELEMF